MSKEHFVWFVSLLIPTAVILLAVMGAWMILEILFDGGIQESVADTVMGLLLVASLVLNILPFKRRPSRCPFCGQAVTETALGEGDGRVA